MATPRIRTTTIGSYPAPDWLIAAPSEQARDDAMRVVFDIQRQAGVDLPTDGELCRFDINHPDTNGMIDYLVRQMEGIRTGGGRSDWEAFSRSETSSYRGRPAGVIVGQLGEGTLNLPADCARSAAVSAGPFKFTITSPYMLARTLVDTHYRDFENLTMAIAQILACQVGELDCACVQIDEANVTGNPAGAELAARAINLVLDHIKVEKAVHLCFGNYGGQTVQKGDWRSLIGFLNDLHADHVALELACRPEEDLDALRDIDPKIKLGIGVVEVKVNRIELPEEVAARIEIAENRLGPDRIAWVHPDCGFWMLKRSIVDRKIATLVAGRNLYLGI